MEIVGIIKNNKDQYIRENNLKYFQAYGQIIF